MKKKLGDILIPQLEKRFIFGEDEAFVEDTLEGLVSLCQPFNYLAKPEGMYAKKSIHPRFILGMSEKIWRLLAKKIPVKHNPFNRYSIIRFVGLGGVNTNLLTYLNPFLPRSEGYDPEKWELHNLCRLCDLRFLRSEMKCSQEPLIDRDTSLFGEGYLGKDGTTLDLKTIKNIIGKGSLFKESLFIGAPNGAPIEEMLQNGDILDVFFTREGIGIEFVKRGSKPQKERFQWLSNDNYWKIRVSDYVAAVLAATFAIPKVVGERENLSLFFRFDKEVAEFKNYLLSI